MPRFSLSLTKYEDEASPLSIRKPGPTRVWRSGGHDLAGTSQKFPKYCMTGATAKRGMDYVGRILYAIQLN